MIKEEIIVKTKEDFDREIDKFKFGTISPNRRSTFYRAPGSSASGIVKRTKTYTINDYAAPVDTLVIVESGGSKRYSSGWVETIDDTNHLAVFSGGETSKTCSSTYWTDIWKWDNSKDAINFLNSKIVDEFGSGISCLAYVESQLVEASYYVEVTVRLVEDKSTEPVVFEIGEKVLVWDYNKDHARVRCFRAFTKGYFEDTYSNLWKNCDKICQKCEKEICECKPEPIFENDELVLVWDNDKDYAKLRYFKEHNTRLGCCFGCWDDGQTSMTSDGAYEHWKNCVKVCQKCGNERCECK